jgi:hypothetical protein
VAPAAAEVVYFLTPESEALRAAEIRRLLAARRRLRLEERQTPCGVAWSVMALSARCRAGAAVVSEPVLEPDTSSR